MENENYNQTPEDVSDEEIVSEPTVKRDYLIPVSILISSVILASAWVYTTGLKAQTNQKVSVASSQQVPVSELEAKVLPSQGIELPVVWGDLGAKLVSTGVIDADKFKAIYEQRGTFTDEYKNLLLGENNGKLKMTSANSGYLLNLLWALGLANKNPILDKGEMVNPSYGGAGNFASTGGWTIDKEQPMDHYSEHKSLNLTPSHQSLLAQ